MITYREALSRLMQQAQAIAETETIPLLYSSGRILAEDVVSGISVPSWDNSQMDGYGVRCADLADAAEDSPVELKVVARVTAGEVGKPLLEAGCVRIMTGAPIPAGVDAVVPQELVEASGGSAVFKAPAAEGSWIRRRGSDVEPGSLILKTGDRLTPGAIGMLASIGRAYVTVFRRVRVGIFFSGDELVQPGNPLPPGGIYNSNRFMIRSLLATLGFEVLDLGSVPDTLEATIDAFQKAAGCADVIITTGGMSVGEKDHVKPAVEQLGEIDLWKVSLKPGKPLAFGIVQGVPFIGIPGNPVAGFVVFLMMARPFLLRRAGASAVEVRPLKIRSDFNWTAGDREEFIRVRRNSEGGLDCYPNQNSQVLSSCAWGDGLVDVPAAGSIRAGDVVDYYPFATFFA